MKNSSFGIALVLLVSACGESRDGNNEPLGTSRDAITGGRLVPFDQHGPPDTSVVRIEFPGIAQCTALKVGLQTFWTAAHCMAAVSQTNTIRITNAIHGGFSYTTELTSYQVHPSYKNYTTNSSLQHLQPYDLARFTTRGISPDVPIYSTTHPAWVGPGPKVTYTAYGCDAIDPTHSGMKQYDFFTLVDKNALAASTGWDTDKAQKYYVHNMAAIGTDPQGCDGDSGAPVFQKLDATWKLVGTVVHGGAGYTGFTRYSNVRNWLTNPAYNLFQIGFQGFLFNAYTGRCIDGLNSTLSEFNCDGRNQDTDTQSWKLQQSGGAPDTFYIVNGSTQKCLDLDTTDNNATVVQRTCNPLSLGANTQRWRFAAVPAPNQPDYRYLTNVQTGRCIGPSEPLNPSFSPLRSQPCQVAGQQWRTQAYVMTR